MSVWAFPTPGLLPTSSPRRLDAADEPAGGARRDLHSQLHLGGGRPASRRRGGRPLNWGAARRASEAAPLLATWEVSGGARASRWGDASYPLAPLAQRHPQLPWPAAARTVAGAE